MLRLEALHLADAVVTISMFFSLSCGTDMIAGKLSRLVEKFMPQTRLIRRPRVRKRIMREQLSASFFLGDKTFAGAS